MMNPYVCRKENNLYYILSENSSEYTILPEVQKQILIVINLYYLDTLERYLNYLSRIPGGIQIIIVSSVEEILEETKEYIQKNRLENVQLLRKENRGRDISAFLVACKNEILKFTYFCFVHDKKTGLKEIDEETNVWIENLWNNTIINEKYISNVIKLFEEHKEIGLLVPPEPIGETRSHWFRNNWGKNFEIAENLLKQLEVNCSIDPHIPVVTLGTAFWVKTKALEKLLKYSWKYEDFMEEPMPIDGTISHAIERILSFVAQDAGYETGTIMCNSYAEKLIGYLQDIMHKMFGVLKQSASYPIDNIRDLLRIGKIENFYNRYESVYLYGAGKVGLKCLQTMRAINCEPKGFVVSAQEACEVIEGVPVISIEQLENEYDMGIIITVGSKLVPEIEDTLKRKGIVNYIQFIKI